MAVIEHKDIVDPNIHEPKGISGATVGTVYRSDGSGSGTWSKVKGSELNSETSQSGQTLISDGAGGFSYGNAEKQAHGGIKLTTSSAVTSLYVAKLNVTTSGAGSPNLFTEATNNKITYTGSEAKNFSIALWIKATAAAYGFDGFSVLKVSVRKNGSSVILDDLDPGPGTNKEAISGATLVRLNPNDYLEVFAYRTGTSSTPTISAFNLSVREI